MFLTLIFVGQSYKGLDLFCSWILKGLGKLQHSLNLFLFWFLFLFIGTSIFIVLWFVFKFIIILINSLITRICPYPKLGEWFISVNVLLSLGYYVYTVWWVSYDTSSFFGIMVCIVVTFMGITLGKIITESTTSIFLERRFQGYAYENMNEKIIEKIRNENKKRQIFK